MEHSALWSDRGPGHTRPGRRGIQLLGNLAPLAGNQRLAKASGVVLRSVFSPATGDILCDPVFNEDISLAAVKNEVHARNALPLVWHDSPRAYDDTVLGVVERDSVSVLPQRESNDFRKSVSAGDSSSEDHMSRLRSLIPCRPR